MNIPDPTPVFETYWRFAADRHASYLKRLRGEPWPWKNDPILQQWKFTNVFRACDRTSQDLIRDVIYIPHTSQRSGAGGKTGQGATNPKRVPGGSDPRSPSFFPVPRESHGNV